MTYVLDTDIASLLMYGRNQNVLDRYRDISKNNRVVLGILTRAEMLRGRIDALLKSSNMEQLLQAQERLFATEQWIMDYEILIFNEAAIREYHRILKSRKPKRMSNADLLIASLCLSHDAILVTRNVRDFQSVSNLTIQNWAD